jgi:hypothetical protein
MTDGLSLGIDLSGLVDTTADLEAYPQWLGREMTIAMDLGLHHLVGHVASRTPVNEAKLRNSIQQSNVSPWPNLVGRVNTPQPYGIVIERGRAPDSNMPPVDAIAQWAVRKLQLSPEEAEGAAWAIAKSIAKHGFSDKGDTGREGAKMFEEGLEAAEPQINQLFNEAVARSVARFNAS